MVSFISDIRGKADFLGVLVATNNFSEFEFYSPHTNDKGKGLYTYFSDYGDCVYFMFVGDHLMKIGKAAGGKGWMTRVAQYKRGLAGDNTNKLILENLKEDNKRVIEVLAIPTPKKHADIECHITGVRETLELETAETFEKLYTQRYLSESDTNELPFCRQLK